MQICGHPQRSREEYESLLRGRRHATSGVQHGAISVVRGEDSMRAAVHEGDGDGPAQLPGESGDSVTASLGNLNESCTEASTICSSTEAG